MTGSNIRRVSADEVTTYCVSSHQQMCRLHTKHMLIYTTERERTEGIDRTERDR